MLVERIGINRDFDPLAAAGHDRQHGGPGIGHPHIVLQLRHVFFGGGFFRKGPRQHELGLEHRASRIDHAVQGGCHPLVN
jgi:hypothetical protein